MDESDKTVAEHGQAVWQTICRILGSHEGASDCFQDTFCQYVQIVGKTNVDHTLALLTRIATRRAIDLIRKTASARRKKRPLDEQYPGPEGEAWTGLVTAELTESLRDALGQLPSDQAAVFCMTQLDQMDPGEVATAMGIDTRHVAVLLHRARTRLQGRLAKHFPNMRRR